MTEFTPLAETRSVCPVCLGVIPARRVSRGSDIFLEKTCAEHGFFRTIVWRGTPDYSAWGRQKVPNPPRNPLTLPGAGCPFDCGFCAAHQQEPCCVLLEVTQRCDLNCPVCFASAGENPPPDPDLAMIETWYRRMLAGGGPFNIQLSGGEPSLRDDLAEIISLGKKLDFSYFQINTNGLRIGADFEYLRGLKNAGLNVVYLQYDGTENTIYQTIRGRQILEQKIMAIRNCQALDLGVVLVPTIVPGVNQHNLGDIIRFALENHPTVRGIHVQPVSYMGRYPNQPSDSDRITLPELITGMEIQTSGLVKASDFQPKGSENSYCSFNASYLIQPDGRLNLIKENSSKTCCSKPESAREGLLRSKNYVVKYWARSETLKNPEKISTISMGGWDDLLEQAKTHHFNISGMAFQDAWNLDLDLLQDCCIGVSAANGNIVPFCAYNLTNIHGQAIYRPGA